MSHLAKIDQTMQNDRTESDMFSFKLTQIPSQSQGADDQAEEDIPSKSMPSTNLSDNIYDTIQDVETFLQLQRVCLIKNVSQEISEEQRREVLNSFFDVLQRKTRNLSRLIQT